MSTLEEIHAIKSFVDLPSDVLVNITSRIALECTLKLGLTDKFGNAWLRARESEFKSLTERDFYFCTLFKNLVDSRGATLPASLKVYQNKSWAGLYIFATSKFKTDQEDTQKDIKDKNDKERHEFIAENEKEEEGVNIVTEEGYHGATPEAYVENSNSAKEIKGITINILLQKLVLGELDPIYLTSLCSAYDCFITLENLLTVIFHKFRNVAAFAPPGKNQKNVGQIVLDLVRRLIVRRGNAFQSTHWRMVEEFTHEIERGDATWATQAQLIWKAITQEIAKKLERRPLTILLQGPISALTILERPAKLLAQQLSLFTSRAYSEITVQDIYELKQPEGAWKHFVNCFNKISSWTVTQILGPPKVKERAKMYQYFIELAQCLFSNKDYHSLAAVISAMNSSMVHRLKHTRAEISSKHTAELERLSEIMDMSSKNSREYRAVLAKTEPPCVPFLGIYYQDMSYVMDGNAPTVTKGGTVLINIWKMRMCNRVISDALIFQNTKYTYAEDYETQLYIAHQIMNCTFLSDMQLYDISLLREPKCSERNELP